jgi:hypothetical protein
MADFDIIGEIADVEVIARGRGIQELVRLNRTYGRSNWRKLKGHATIRLRTGRIRRAEVHWYEGHGLGKHEIKRKRYLD